MRQESIHDSGAPRKVRQRMVGAALGILAVAALFWMRRPTAGEPHARAPSPTPAAAVAPLAAHANAPKPARIAAAPVSHDDAHDPSAGAAVIEAAYPEKREVCRGEENFFVVKAHTKNDTDASLAVTVYDPNTSRFVRGPRVAFRLDESGVEPFRVAVESETGETQITVPPVTVKDCDAPSHLVVQAHEPISAPDRIQFVAETRTMAPLEREHFVPVSYTWDFGDGTSMTGASARAEHSYEGRSQNTRLSSFIVKVTARDRNGQEASGSYTQTFANRGYLLLRYKNHVALNTGIGTSDVASESIWFYHGYDQPVSIERVTMREVSLGVSPGRDAETTGVNYPPHEILGFSSLPPGKSVTLPDLDRLRPAAGNVVRYFEVVGRTADGKAALGRFSLLHT